ncbi:uncharacterized protein LOC120424800 isoform X1 [Culex pipiens pallens]|uniref:uncharacterized protein LOC120424800 isoform X1 n=1 Tax=Culex pipiens pallens TaxID=42434 RepID=UPI00195307AF|nr:uncharacterized protein LOC120424800 isoform X1 [Culex pipiens pallens]
MILCIDHADAVEISDCIAESLFNETMVKLPDLGHSAQLQHKGVQLGQPSQDRGPQIAREERVQSLGRMDRLPEGLFAQVAAHLPRDSDCRKAIVWTVDIEDGVPLDGAALLKSATLDRPVSGPV